MLYKTIVLKLLEQFPQLHSRLRDERQLLAALSRYSTELKTRHQELTDQFSAIVPGSNPEQLVSESLEVAVKELSDRLLDLAQQDNDPLALDAAIASVRRSTPTGSG